MAAHNFAEGNTGMGIAQIINLVSIVFSMFNPTCFTGDTPVYTDDGLVCIEDIEVGDEVWAYNYETGEKELKEVLNVWIKETDEILHVSTSDGETIDTTTNHPFYVDGKGWVAAGDLEIGDTLATADGDEVEVTDVEIEKLAEPILVYNLEINDCHTYFIGEYGILVHNECLARYQSGTVVGGENLTNPAKAMQNNGDRGVIPKDVADQLRGKTFKNFDEFRESFWKAFSNTSYANEFNAGNIANMANGHAPAAPTNLKHEGIFKYALHHLNPIAEGGGVYDLDNLIIVSPALHNYIHYGFR